MDFRQAYDPIRSLGGAWQLVAKAPLTLIIGSVLLFLTGMPEGLHIEGERLHWFGLLLVGPVVAAGCCLGFLIWLANCAAHLGVASAVRRVAASGEERLSDLLDMRGLFGVLVL